MGFDIPIAQAKARFAEVIRRAEAGETIVLTRHGRPVARLTRPPERESERLAPEVREATLSYGAARPQREVQRARTPRSRREALERLLEESIWPAVPEGQLGAAPSKREREAILGYGEDGA